MTIFYYISASGKPWGDFSDILYNGYITSYGTYDKEHREAMELCAKGECSEDEFDEWLLRTDVPVYPPEQRLLVRTGPFYVDFGGMRLDIVAKLAKNGLRNAVWN